MTGVGGVSYTIAYQDEHLLVVDKGPGVVVHPARGHRENTLAQMLAPMIAGGEAERAGGRPSTKAMYSRSMRRSAKAACSSR